MYCSLVLNILLHEYETWHVLAPWKNQLAERDGENISMQCASEC